MSNELEKTFEAPHCVAFAHNPRKVKMTIHHLDVNGARSFTEYWICPECRQQTILTKTARQ